MAELNFERIRHELDTEGYSVIPGVLSEEFCEERLKEYSAWLKNFGDDFPENYNSIIHQYSVAHATPSWKVRLAVKHVFSGVWGTEKLLTSYDGVAIGEPPESGRFDFGTIDSHSLHLDQGPPKSGLHAYQGAVYLEQADVTDWCFQVLPQSHLHFEDFFKEHKTDGDEYRPIFRSEMEWYRVRGCERKRVAVPRGGMVLWDSRLVHDGAKPLPDRPAADRWRFVNFVSMTPAIWASEQDLQARRAGFKRLKCSRHWSSTGFELFWMKKTDPRRSITSPPDIMKTEEVLKLAGIVDYNFSDGAANGPNWKPKFVAV